MIPPSFPDLTVICRQLLKPDAKKMAHIVARSYQIKAKVVEQDERKDGLCAILNYGHAIGHAPEAISG